MGIGSAFERGVFKIFSGFSKSMTYVYASETSLGYKESQAGKRIAFTEEDLLNMIAPKGTIQEGVSRFEVTANIEIPDSCRSYIKAGCTVNAEIVIDRKKHVLALEEKYFQFSYDSVYVEIQKENGDYEKRFLKTGISDGTYTEIVSGLDSLDRIKVTENK